MERSKICDVNPTPILLLPLMLKKQAMVPRLFYLVGVEHKESGELINVTKSFNLGVWMEKVKRE